MKKRLLLFLAVTLICALSAFALVACGGKGGDSEGKSKVGGTYYLCVDDELDDSMYITFNNGTWTDDADETGSYTVTDNSITLYVSFDGEETEYAVGTVDGDDITLNIMGANVVYRKGEDIGNKPAEKTLEYILNNDKSGYTVKGIGGLEGDIVIPAEYKRKPVTAIEAGAFKNRAELTGIVVGENVVSIGEKAFLNCANLTAVTLGERVEKIEASTFEDCKKLARVTVPASVTRVEYDAFKNCDSLVDVYYTGSASDWAGIEFPYNIGSQQIQMANFLYATYLSSTGLQELYRKLYINDELLTDADLTECEQLNPFAFYRYKYLESATIDGTLTEIGAYAFRSCSSLETVTIQGGSLVKIGESAFDGSGITAVSLPESCRRIEQYAFNNCYDLYSVNVGNGVNYIGSGAFMGCDMLAELSLGNSVAEIKDGAFYGCFALETVTIPSSAIFIGESAFLSTGLTSATFGSPSGWKVKKVGGLEAVENLSDAARAATLLKSGILLEGYGDYDWEKPTLKYTLSSDGNYYTVGNDGTACRSEIVIPETYNGKPVKALADNAFEYCGSLTSITLPACIESIPTSAFSGCVSLESIKIDGVSDYYATNDGILYNSDLTQVIFVPSAKTEIILTCDITDSMFEGNTTLKKVVIAEGVTSIGDNAFSECRGLTDVTISDTVTSIGNSAFRGCSNLTNIIIGNGVTSIGSRAFSYCTNLTNITIGENVASIGNSAFGDCGRLIIYCEAESKPSGWDNYWDGYDNCPIIWDCKNNDDDKDGYKYVIIDGIRYILKDGTATVMRQSEIISGNVTIHEIVKYKNVAYSVISIEDGAFYGCGSITSITIPNSVMNIGDNTFTYCSNLRYITVMENNPNYSSQDGILYDKEKTKFILIPQAIKGEVTIPNGITSIKIQAFSDRDKLTSVTIGNNVTSIERSAFFGCSSLTDITFKGTIEQWNAIEKSDGWNHSTGNYTIHCTDGDIEKNS